MSLVVSGVQVERLLSVLLQLLVELSKTAAAAATCQAGSFALSLEMVCFPTSSSGIRAALAAGKLVA